MKNSAFKIKKEVKNLEELTETLKQHLDPKFQITIEKANSGLKKLVAGSTSDLIKIKKNAYHGVIVTLTEKSDALDYQVIGANMYVPNPLLNQIFGHEGYLDKFICGLLFGKGKDLYDTLQEKFVSEFEGKPIDMSLLGNAKAILKGKTVFDD